MYRFSLVTGVAALLFFAWAQVQGMNPFVSTVSSSSSSSSGGTGGRISHK